MNKHHAITGLAAFAILLLGITLAAACERGPAPRELPPVVVAMRPAETRVIEAAPARTENPRCRLR